MNSRFSSRREFLADVGRGMLVATVGIDAAHELGFSNRAFAAQESEGELSFGNLERLVRVMQETPAQALMPLLVEKWRGGMELRQIVAAGALANARTFGGEDYVGFHTMMAMAPAFSMSQELPTRMQALPVLKVLYRNTHRIQEHGGRKGEVLHSVQPSAAQGREENGKLLRSSIHKKDVTTAEQNLAALTQISPEDTLNQLLLAVQEQTEVHRVVLPYRSWDMLQIIGMEQAQTLLRQSVRYCVKAESWSNNPQEPRVLFPNLLEEHKLLDRSRGTREVDDKWVGDFSETLFKSTPTEAAKAAAGALAEGVHPNAVGEAITLAANQLVLRDLGRPPREESLGKPPGSVHGDSIGVHATDSANAWRNLSRVSNPRNCFASLIAGAYQVALDRVGRGGDFLNWAPLPYGWQYEQVKGITDPKKLLQETEEAIRGNLQTRAAAAVHIYGQLGNDPRPLLDLLLGFAISEDGALHAEKFYRTSTEEFSSARGVFRWRFLVALARVTASEYGRPAPGVSETRALLQKA